MKKNTLFFYGLMAGLLALGSCRKAYQPEFDNNILANEAKGLKDISPFQVGASVDYNLIESNANYRSIVTREFDNITTGNTFKHFAIVQNDGSLDFTTADALYNFAAQSRLKVYGHTLVWYANNNTTYLNTLIQSADAPLANFIQNGGFENVSGSTISNWESSISAPAQGSVSVESTDVYDGENSLKVVETTPGANPWDIQMQSEAWTATAGKTYTVSFYAKGSGSAFNFVNQSNNHYQANSFTPTSAWAQYSVTVTSAATDPQMQTKFQFPNTGTFYIDDVIVTDGVTTSADVITPAIQDTVGKALHNFVTGMVAHFKGQVMAWDAANEVISDATGGLRMGPEPGQTVSPDMFFWGKYLGRGYIANVFNWAHAADPDALLFINDYNLEYSSLKLDSLIAFVKELQSQNVPISGIGTQMHINANTSKPMIDQMFQKLAGTGLKVRVSELDISMNVNNDPSFVADSATLTTQSDLYNYVAQSYIKNVPAAQRFGITVWGIGDKDSWIQNNNVPLLFDVNYAKKPAYYGFLQGLESE